MAERDPTGRLIFAVARRWLAIPVVLVLAAGLWLFGNPYLRPTSTRPPARVVASTPLPALNSATEYMIRGDRDFDAGDYDTAIADYTHAIALKPDHAEAFNNRAYTYMTMQEYAAALPDLDEAIRLRPSYVNALMNRGDMYNYYYQIDRARAIEDYDRVLALDPTAAQHTSVCGHRAIAENNGMTPVFFVKMILSGAPGRDGACTAGQTR
jgi:tetratricopeptide (TPR) repeat protein